METYPVFVGHAFGVEDKEDLRDAIKRAFKNTKFDLWYADLVVRDTHILTKIEEKIRSSRIAIFDVSTANPNVCMEFGYARGANRNWFIIYKSSADIPANLRGLDAIEYPNYAKLISELRKKIIRPEIARIEREERFAKFHGPLSIAEQDVFRYAAEIYQAEDLPHRFGEKVEDTAANNQTAWVADLSKGNSHFIYGPYEALGEFDDYVVIFKMKINDISHDRQLIVLDVFEGGEGGKGVFEAFRVRGSNFAHPHVYQFFGIPFTCDHEGDLEYRAENKWRPNVKVWTDYVAVVKNSAMLAMENEGKL